MQSTRTVTELGVFEHFEDANRAVGELVVAGVSADRISVACSEGLPEFATDVDTVEGSVAERRLPSVLRGGAIGTLLGGAAAATGLFVTGGAAVLVFGPLLGGAAAGIAGGFVGAMTSRGLEPDAADFYDHAVNDGSILVAVGPAPDGSEPSQERVRDVLRERGAHAHGTAAG